MCLMRGPQNYLRVFRRSVATVADCRVVRRGTLSPIRQSGGLSFGKVQVRAQSEADIEMQAGRKLRGAVGLVAGIESSEGHHER
jgi:hypothetical protein